MSLTLDATLATAQDSQSRRPLIEIISSRRKDDIPFEGNAITAETYNEYGVNAIPHSSGRLCAAYCYGPDADSDCGIKFVYTDVDRLEFFTTTIELFTSSSYVMTGVTLCEMTGGNVCLAYLYTYGGNYYLASRIVTVTGTLVAGSVKAIGNWATTTFTSDPWLHTLTTNSYLMLYAKQSGSDYYIYKRTSSDCLTWSAESALTIAGIATTLKLDNPSLLKISTGDLWLWFDVLESTSVGNPLKNVYYSVSADSGSTWSAATKFTSYDNYGSIGTHPVAVQKTTDQMTMAYTQTDAALHMDDTVDVWPAGDYSMELSLDAANRKLYVVNGTAIIQNIVRVDMDTWTCDKAWTYVSVPAIPAVFSQSYCSRYVSTVHNDGHHIFHYANTVGQYEAAIGAYAIYLNGDDDTMITYKLGAYAYGGNVEGFPGDSAYNTLYRAIHAAWVDATNSKIWIVSTIDYAAYLQIGYLTIGEAPDGNGCYTYTPVVGYAPGAQAYITGLIYCDWKVSLGGFLVNAATNTMYVGSASENSKSLLAAFDMTTGGLLWVNSTSSGYFGYGCPIAVVDGKLYATGHDTMPVWRYHDHVLIEVDAATGENEEHYTPDFWGASYWPVWPLGYLRMLTTGCEAADGVLAIHSAPYGLALFDTETKAWSVLNNTNTPGLTTDGNYLYPYGQIVYDDDTNMIIFGDWYRKGIVAVNEDGAIKRTYYSTGTYSGAAWSFTDPDNLVDGYYDYDAGLCVEPGSTSSMYAFWINWDTDTTEYSILWDKDGSTMEISDFLTSDEVTTRHSIDGSPASLDFTVSHGHLFDNYNLSSALSNVLKKGNELTLRFGENVSGTEYWQKYGTYIVTETSISFRRGQYPVMRVRAEDQRCIWDNHYVYATSSFNAELSVVLESILGTHAGLTAADLNIPSFGDTIEHQWMETELIDIINQLCERGCYYFRFDVDGKANAKLISNAAAVDHAYTGNSTVISYTPDDKYSDFTNRVTVRGQSLTFTEVTYGEERITALSGSLGWWGCKAEHEIWYSEDRSRRAINPRLEVIESSCSIPLQLAGSIDEYLEAGTGDDAEKYCTVYADAPNLVPALIAAIGGLVAAMFVPDGVVAVGFIGNAGSTVCIGSALRTAIMIQINMILGSVANYQFAVWAQPLGEIRQSCQGQWNDTDHQAEINAIIEKVIDDPLCYTYEQCEEVATNEGMIAQMQRRRVKIEKVAHLQDEDGDTISVLHPYSNQAMTLFIADLTRKFKKSEPGSNDGYFLDELEGWICE